MTSAEILCYPLEKTDKNWRIIGDPIGSGVYGTVWAACSDLECQYVMKVSKFTSKYTKQRFLKEVHLQKIFASLCLGVDLEDSWQCSEAGIIIMPAMEITLNTFITENKLTDEDYRKLTIEVKTMIDKLHRAGYYHGDAHFENIMLRNIKNVQSKICNMVQTSIGTYEMLFIDSGLSGNLDRPGYKGKKEVTRIERITDDLKKVDSELKLYIPRRSTLV